MFGMRTQRHVIIKHNKIVTISQLPVKVSIPISKRAILDAHAPVVSLSTGSGLNIARNTQRMAIHGVREQIRLANFRDSKNEA